MEEAGGRSRSTGDSGTLQKDGRRCPLAAVVRSLRKRLQLFNRSSLLVSDRSECPAYPTELVFGLDMSEDVTPAAFERQRSALLALLNDITIAESNCPTGARVAVVGYSDYANYLIRFHDYRRKTQLVELVKNIAMKSTSNARQLGAAMRFVGQNVFKRVRAGAMMRKVAVFLANGPPQDFESIVTAVMEYRGLNIIPAVISLKNVPAIRRAMEVGLPTQLPVAHLFFML